MYAVKIRTNGKIKTMLFETGKEAKETCIKYAKNGFPAMKLRSAR